MKGPAHILKDTDTYWCGRLRPHSDRVKLFGGLEHAIREAGDVIVCAACCDAGISALESLKSSASDLIRDGGEGITIVWIPEAS